MLVVKISLHRSIQTNLEFTKIVMKMMSRFFLTMKFFFKNSKQQENSMLLETSFNKELFASELTCPALLLSATKKK